VNNQDHQAEASGTLSITNFVTNIKLANASIEIFDGGVHPNHAIYLHYFLPFQYQGDYYHLEGFKLVAGNNCFDILEMVTTLYVYVRKGTVLEQGDILYTGIVVIEPLNILPFLLSFHQIGNGSNADFLNALLLFGEFLAHNIKDNCFNISAFENDFWYIWSSNGENGFLLDLIKRPDILELRLDTFDINQNPVAKVNKQFLSLSDFKVSDNYVKMGPIVLTKDSCSGKVSNDFSIDLIFKLSDRKMDFIPDFIENRFPYLPDVRSQYGNIINGSCNGISYAKLPIVYTTYPVPILMGWWQWAMISAMSFEGTDLEIELVSTNFEGIWIGTSYIYFEGKEYLLNNPFLLETIMDNYGEPKNGKRTISATLMTLSISFTITCEAPVEWFAVLEQEGNTFIHTTLLGSCKAKNEKTGKSYIGKGALLEVKSVDK